MKIKDRSAVSLTGRYTGEVWVRQGLSPEHLSTPAGRFLYRALRPLDRTAARWPGISLETMLVQRHCMIDQLLMEQIQEAPGTQIVEFAGGTSNRGRRLLAQTDAPIRYLDTDLPDVVMEKRQCLSQQPADPRHELRACNILRNHGDLSPESLLAELDPNQPVVAVTEGLLNYFPLVVVEGFVERLAQALSGFARNRYLTEIWPRLPQYPGTRVRGSMIALIEGVTRQRVPLHYEDDQDITVAFSGCGFNQVRVLDPDTFEFVRNVPRMAKPSLFRVVDASVTGEGGV